MAITKDTIEVCRAELRHLTDKFDKLEKAEEAVQIAFMAGTVDDAAEQDVRTFRRQVERASMDASDSLIRLRRRG
jgi:hypothetical protein